MDNLREKVDVELESISAGGDSLNYRRCAYCRGKGIDRYYTRNSCPTCGGTGRLAVFPYQQIYECPVCDGDGAYIYKRCHKCSGRGFLYQRSKIFISHTKKDKKFCDRFDSIVARVGFPAYRSEFEKIEKPAWKDIIKAINDSVAIFVLIGKELVESQDSRDPEWRFTQNWIAYEIGVASQIGIDVWAICDNISINFPMPCINNYLPTGLGEKETFGYARSVLEKYKEGETFPYPFKDLGVECQYDDCKLGFNLHTPLAPKHEIKCPQCLRKIK